MIYFIALLILICSCLLFYWLKRKKRNTKEVKVIKEKFHKPTGIWKYKE